MNKKYTCTEPRLDWYLMSYLSFLQQEVAQTRYGPNWACGYYGIYQGLHDYPFVYLEDKRYHGGNKIKNFLWKQNDRNVNEMICFCCFNEHSKMLRSSLALRASTHSTLVEACINSLWRLLPMRIALKQISRFFSESSDRKGSSVRPLVC